MRVTFAISAPTDAHAILTSAEFLDTLDSANPGEPAEIPTSQPSTS